jgi:PST family polysaccharide transporter
MSTASDLSRKGVTAVKWCAAGSGAKYFLQLGAQIVLARLLGPENYGLFAIGMIVLTFGHFVGTFGFAWGLVQSQDLRQEDIRFVFTSQLISGSLVTVGLYAIAPAVAAYFSEPRVEPIVRWLSLACVIQAIAAPAINLLKRNLDFRALNIIEIVSYSIGYLTIGIPLACYGAGVWSLVAAWLAQALCTLLLAFVRCPHPIKPLIWYDGALAQLNVGFTVFATNICNWLLNNIDRIVLGRFVNAHAVGLYVVGYNLATTPAMLIGSVQPAFLAAGARIQSEPDRLRRAYLSVIATVWVLVAPLFVILAIVAQDLVGILYGSAWESSGIVLAILALSMPAYLTFGVSTPVLWNTGCKHYESLLQLPILVLAAVAFYSLSGQGIVMVAVVTASVLLTRTAAVTTKACLQLGIRAHHLVPSLMRASAMVLLASTGSLVGVELGQMVWPTRLGAFFGGTVVGCSTLIAASLIVPQLLGSAVIEMLGRFSPSIAPAFGGHMLSAFKKR